MLWVWNHSHLYQGGKPCGRRESLVDGSERTVVGGDVAEQTTVRDKWRKMKTAPEGQHKWGHDKSCTNIEESAELDKWLRTCQMEIICSLFIVAKWLWRQELMMITMHLSIIHRRLVVLKAMCNLSQEFWSESVAIASYGWYFASLRVIFYDFWQTKIGLLSPTFILHEPNQQLNHDNTSVMNLNVCTQKDINCCHHKYKRP